ncbi:MAG: trypsin-like peptidase domain-containing protein [Elusimicrobia bacterium]|nr:trypsin-like peptidase domain-containing protein [Elusimicrobiota bacterium]
MKKTVFASLALFICAAAGAQDEAFKVQRVFNEVAARAKPAVVALKVVREESETFIEPEFFFGYVVPRERTYSYDVQGAGSGFIIDPEGHILTNYHVVEGASRIRVSLADANGKEKTYMASVAGGDPALDLAVLKIKSRDKFPYLELDYSDKVKVGDFALAVGYPFGFRQTVTSGIISALNAGMKVGGRKYEKLIQTDAAINRGNSGGPLLNLDGRVIGVNAAIFSPSGAFAGVGFAIPAAEIKRVLADLVAGRKVKRGWLGVSVVALDSVMAAGLGLDIVSGGLVNAVAKGSPAYEAAIVRGDVITECDGEPLEAEDDLFYRTYTRRPGDVIELTLISKGLKKKEKITLAERPAENADVVYTAGRSKRADLEPRKSACAWEGLELRFEEGGAIVDRISGDSRLFGYLRRADVIKAVNRNGITSAAEMPAVFGAANLSEGVLFDLERNGEGKYISVQVK